MHAVEIRPKHHRDGSNFLWIPGVHLSARVLRFPGSFPKPSFNPITIGKTRFWKWEGRLPDGWAIGFAAVPGIATACSPFHRRARRKQRGASLFRTKEPQTARAAAPTKTPDPVHAGRNPNYAGKLFDSTSHYIPKTRNHLKYPQVLRSLSRY